MNPDIERQLMITVERVVRPLAAASPQTHTMRMEMLGHLKEVYQEELERGGGDEIAALAQARLRFGEPEELTKQLQASVPRWRRWACRWIELFRCNITASPMRNAFRLTSVWFVELFVLFTLCDLMVMWRGMSPWPMTAILLTPLVCLTSIAFVALQGAFAAIQVADSDSSYWRVTRSTCWKLAALGFLYKCVLLMQTIPFWDRLGLQELMVVVLSTVLLPVLFLFVMWAARKEFEREIEWARLDLSEG